MFSLPNYLRGGVAILLRGILLPPVLVSDGLGSALLTGNELAVLFGIGIPELDIDCKLVDCGMLLLPCIVGLT